jgi:hypothetical protein
LRQLDFRARAAARYADVAFTMRRYVQADLPADRQVAETLAELIVGGSLASALVVPESGGDTHGGA